MPEHAAVIDLATLDGSNGFFIQSAQAGGLGLNVSVGDINGDGVDDLFVGAREEVHGGQNQAGSAYALYGSAKPWATVLNLDLLKPKQGFELYGQTQNLLAGESVALGDFDGDGNQDMAVGADGANSFGGAAYVRFNAPATASAQVAALNGTNGFAVTRPAGVEPSTYLGTSVAAADLNGDGRDELIVSQPNANHGGVQAGEVHVVVTPSDGAAIVDPGALEGGDGSGGFTISGEAGDRLGVSVSVGDVNGDGIPDLVTAGGGGAGGGVCVFGSEDLVVVDGLLTGADLDGGNGFQFDLGHRVALGDLNGDGRADLIVGNDTAGSNFQGEVFVSFSDGSEDPTRDLNGLTGANGFHITGSEAFSFLGAILETGDINHDGIDDLILGVPGIDASGRLDAGAVYVVFGRASGFPAEVDLTTLDGSDGFKVIGQSTGADYGYSVAAVDMNADGLLDIALGSYARQEMAVVFGELPTGPVTRLGTPISQTIHGGDDNDILGGGVGHDVLFGHDGDDKIDGGIGRDTLDGGSGNDKLVGNQGEDTVVYERAASGVDANLSEGTSNGGGGSDILKKVEHITGSLYNDTFRGNGKANRIDGNDGADYIFGASGDDTLIGGAGRDEIEGSDGGDLLIGGSFNDSLYGGTGPDTLIGGTGRDRISLGFEDNVKDVVRYEGVGDSRPGAADEISDFDIDDVIDLSAIDAHPVTSEDDPFTVVNTFTGVGGEVKVTVVGGTAIVAVDVDGDKDADMEIRIEGAPPNVGFEL